jgi:hypothetical protein
MRGGRGIGVLGLGGGAVLEGEEKVGEIGERRRGSTKKEHSAEGRRLRSSSFAGSRGEDESCLRQIISVMLTLAASGGSRWQHVCVCGRPMQTESS